MTNKEALGQKLANLLDRPLFNCLSVYSRGHKLMILKDKDMKLFLLLIPQKPVDMASSRSIQNLGFSEIWPSVNYTFVIHYNTTGEIERLIDIIQSLFADVLKVNGSRKWRYQIDSQSAVLKDTRTALITRQEISVRSFKNLKRKKLFQKDYVYAIYVCLGIIVFGAIADYDIIDHPIEILPLYGISFLLVLAIKLLFKYDFEYFSKKRFLSYRSQEFFNSNGFSKKADIYRGQIKGYRTEFYYSKYSRNVIVVFHKEIMWEDVLRLSKKSNIPFSSEWEMIGTHYSKKTINRLISKRKLLAKAEEFVDYLISKNLERTNYKGRH
jgi:hypothetical protein